MTLLSCYFCNHYNKKGVSKTLASRQTRVLLTSVPGMRERPGDPVDQNPLKTIDTEK